MGDSHTSRSRHLALKVLVFTLIGETAWLFLAQLSLRLAITSYMNNQNPIP